MSNRKLTILAIITVCVIVWAVFQSHISNRHRTEAEKPAYLIQGLDPSSIDTIVLGAGKNKVTLKRHNRRFVITEKSNYPAEMSDVNSLITSCIDIKVNELFTDNPANHKELGVTEDDAKYVVKFFKNESDLMVGVIIGKGSEVGRGTFARMIPGDKVFVALDRPWIKDQALNYINRELFSVERKDIESVTVNSPSGSYTLKTDDSGENITLEKLPAGKKLKADVCETVFTALNNFRLEDVMKESDSGKELAFDRQFICRLKDSTIYKVDIAQKDDKIFITCSAEFTDKTPVTKEEGVVESEDELKKKEAKLIAIDKAEDLSTRHSGWLYQISESDAGKLTKKLSELLEDEDKEGPVDK